MKIKIISDSTCDLSKELCEKYDIAIAPLSVTLGDNTYKDGVEMDVEDIYAYVDKTGSLPTTNADNVADYMDIFREWKDKGYDSIVQFNISSDFSSSYQNACIAAEEFEDVYVVDSRNLSTGQGLVVLKGAELAAEGKSAKEIHEICTAMTSHVEASFVIDKLDYLYKGGRCSAVAALGANLLKLKPCVEVVGGKMDTVMVSEEDGLLHMFFAVVADNGDSIDVELAMRHPDVPWGDDDYPKYPKEGYDYYKGQSLEQVLDSFGTMPEGLPAQTHVTDWEN